MSSSTSWQLYTLNFLLNNPFKRLIKLTRDLNVVRQSFQHSAKLFKPLKSINSEIINIDGLTAEWLYHQSMQDVPVKVLYLHGGGYCLGSIKTHHTYLTYFSFITKTSVLSIDYRLAPEHPFPAALEDSLKAYEYLMRHKRHNDRIIIAGESAGGGLCMATLMAIRDRGWPLPDAAICLSPWLDLTQSGESVTYNRTKDKLLDLNQVNDAAALYSRDYRVDHPLLSPLKGQFTGLPPLFIQTSRNELFLSDALALKTAAEHSGVNVTMQIWDNVPHAWTYFAPVLPEARSALRHIQRFIESLTTDVPLTKDKIVTAKASKQAA